MSRKALLQAVVDVLRAQPPDGLAYAKQECGLALPGGQPPAWAGKVYLGVWAGSRKNLPGGKGWAIDTTYAAVVTLSLRVNEPPDRVGSDLLTRDAAGLWDRAEAVEDLLTRDTHDFLVGRRANVILGDPLTGDEPTGFRGGLVFESDDVVGRLVDSTWWWGDGKEKNAGAVLHMRFGGARRVKNLANVGQVL